MSGSSVHEDPFGTDPFACPRLDRAARSAWHPAAAHDGGDEYGAADRRHPSPPHEAASPVHETMGSMGSPLDAESVISLGSSSTGRRLWVSGNTLGQGALRPAATGPAAGDRSQGLYYDKGQNVIWDRLGHVTCGMMAAVPVVMVTVVTGVVRSTTVVGGGYKRCRRCLNPPPKPCCD